MSTIPKGAEITIENEYKLLVKKLRNMKDVVIPMSQALQWKKGAEYGYQLATDGREELEKENRRLMDSYDKVNADRTKQLYEITALQSSLKEKDAELNRAIDTIHEYQKGVQLASEQIEELKAENERLKGEVNHG